MGSPRRSLQNDDDEDEEKKKKTEKKRIMTMSDDSHLEEGNKSRKENSFSERGECVVFIAASRLLPMKVSIHSRFEICIRSLLAFCAFSAACLCV